MCDAVRHILNSDGAGAAVSDDIGWKDPASVHAGPGKTTGKGECSRDRVEEKQMKNRCTAEETSG